MIAGDPALVEVSADDLSGAGDDLHDAAASVGSRARQVTAWWTGAASDAALEAITGLRTAVGTAGDVFADAVPVLRTYAEALRDAQTAYEQGYGQEESGLLTTQFLGVGATTPGGAGHAQYLEAQSLMAEGRLAMAAATLAAEQANTEAATAIDALTERLTALPASTRPAWSAGSSLGARALHVANEHQHVGQRVTEGLVDSAVDTATGVAGLVGLHGDFTDNWAAVGQGVMDLFTEPLAETTRDAAELDTLEEEGTAYWLGGLAGGVLIFRGPRSLGGAPDGPHAPYPKQGLHPESDPPGAPPVDWGSQGKHLEGHPHFEMGRSALAVDPRLLTPWGGTGTPVNNVPRGEPGFRERVDFGETIGTFVTPTGESVPTSVGLFHYRKDGSVHIVPGRPS